MTNVKKFFNVTNAVIFVQSIIISSVYLYTRINKWNLQEMLTIFIYPFYSIGIIGIMFISCMVSTIYFIAHLVNMKKAYSGIPLLTNVIVIVIAITFFNENGLRGNNFVRYKNDREYIINLIEKGKLQPDDKGKIEIPESLRNSEMERNGYVRFIKYGSEIGVYFCVFTGLLETSSGYIYFSDKISVDKISSENITLFNNYEENWYFCSTD